MKFKIEKAELERMLNKVHFIVPLKNAKPVLMTILIEGNEKQLKISATDEDVAITVIGSANIEEKGSFLVSEKELFNTIKQLPEQEISFDVGDTAKIKCGKSKFSMPTMGVDEFPALLQEETKTQKLKISTDILKRGIDKTIFAVGENVVGSTILGGVLFESQKDKIVLVSTDGHKMSVYNSKNEGTELFRFVILPKVWKEVSNLSEEILISFGKQVVSFVAGNTVITSRVLEGEFPPYEAVMPKNNDKQLVVSKNDFIDTIKRAVVFAPEISKLIKIIIDKELLTIEASSIQGEAKEELVCKYRGDPIEIGFNGTYLLAILSKIDTDNVIMTLKSPEGAGMILPETQVPNEEVSCLVMPIKLM